MIVQWQLMAFSPVDAQQLFSHALNAAA